MPKFIIIAEHIMTTSYSIEANSFDEALYYVNKDKEGEAAELEAKSLGEQYVDGSFRALYEDSANLNTIKYAVYESVSGQPIGKQGDQCGTWEAALTAYLTKFPLRNLDLEVLELQMAVNGEPAQPVWEEKFFDHVSDTNVNVKSVRDPRDSTNQLVRG